MYVYNFDKYVATIDLLIFYPKIFATMSVGVFHV